MKFRSAYNGTVQVYLHLRSAAGLGAYSVLVGRRGAVRENYVPTNPDGSLVESPAAPVTPVPHPKPATTNETPQSVNRTQLIHPTSITHEIPENHRPRPRRPILSGPVPCQPDPVYVPVYVPVEQKAAPRKTTYKPKLSRNRSKRAEGFRAVEKPTPTRTESADPAALARRARRAEVR